MTRDRPIRPQPALDSRAFLTGATCLTKRGWPVLPVSGKEPPLPAWPTEATTDLERIARWAERWLSLNIGVVTGSRSGLVVLDVDVDRGGEASLEQLQQQAGSLPATLTSRTGGGGLHLFFQHPGGRVRSGTNVLGPGLDLRADGGFVVAPPSRHRSGMTHRWESAPSQPLACWPHSLALLVAGAEQRALPPPRPGAAAPRSTSDPPLLRGLLAAVRGAAVGQRNNTLHWASCRAAEDCMKRRLPVPAAYEALVAAGQQAGLPRSESLCTVRSAFTAYGLVIA